MKHLLNDMSEEEKNAIREQHAGGMKVMTENFSKLLNSKLGDVKSLDEQMVDKISTQNSKPDTNNVNKAVLEFIRFIQTYYGAQQFGKGNFMKKPVTAGISTASNISVTDESGKKIAIPGEQLYRIKLKSILDNSNPYMTIELDKRGLSTKPFVTVVEPGDSKRFDLLTQMNELKSYLNNKTTHY